jgi:hypothetical protein
MGGFERGWTEGWKIKFQKKKLLRKIVSGAKLERKKGRVREKKEERKRRKRDD